MSDHGGGDHAPTEHAPQASGGGGGGGGGGGLTLTFGNGVLLFFGAPLLVLAFGWMGAHRGLVSLVIFVVITVVFLLLPFWMFRLAWTIPFLKLKNKSKLTNVFVSLLLRSPAIMLASWCLLYLWWQAQYRLWHPERSQPFVGDFVDHIPLAILFAILIWVGMNLVHRVIEWFFQWLVGIPGWPEPHTGDH